MVLFKNDDMALNYKTGKLPPNFISLGILLLAISIWRFILLDWKGILFFVISVLCLSIKSGFLIDTNNKQLKEYIGIFILKWGKWKDIHTLINLQIIKIKAKQSMNVLSINRIETKTLYKLNVVLPDKKIELLTGEKDYIIEISKEIAHSLQIKVLNNIQN